MPPARLVYPKSLQLAFIEFTASQALHTYRLIFAFTALKSADVLQKPRDIRKGAQGGTVEDRLSRSTRLNRGPPLPTA